VRDHWVPLFDKYTVDLVISGHNHCYQRILPLRRGAVVSHELDDVDSNAATTYVTVGGGGAGFDPVGFGRSPNYTRVATPDGPVSEPAPWARGVRGLEHSVLVVDVSPSSPGTPARMHLRAVTSSGRTADQWQIVRRARPSAQAPSGSGGWLWPDGAAALAGIGAVGAVGAAAAVRRRRATPADEPGS
jgi:hypothetical protein